VAWKKAKYYKTCIDCDDRFITTKRAKRNQCFRCKPPSEKPDTFIPTLEQIKASTEKIRKERELL